MPVQMYRSPSEIGNLSAGPQNILNFKVSLRRRDNHEVNLRRSHRSVSKYNQSSPRVCPSSSQVQRTLVLCKERTLRDSFKIAVVTNTRPERSATKKHMQPPRKCCNWALKARHEKHGNRVIFKALHAKGARLKHLRNTSTIQVQ